MEVQSVQTLESKRDWALSMCDSREAERERCNVVVDGRGHGWTSLKTFIKAAGPADVDSVLRQLNAGEENILNRHRLEDVQRQTDERRAELREGEQTVQEQADAMVTRVEATRAAMDANSVERKLDKLIAINERIAVALEKR